VDTDHWEFANEFFVEGKPDLLLLIQRRKPPSAAAAHSHQPPPQPEQGLHAGGGAHANSYASLPAPPTAADTASVSLASTKTVFAVPSAAGETDRSAAATHSRHTTALVDLRPLDLGAARLAATFTSLRPGDGAALRAARPSPPRDPGRAAPHGGMAAPHGAAFAALAQVRSSLLLRALRPASLQEPLRVPPSDSAAAALPVQLRHVRTRVALAFVRLVERGVEVCQVPGGRLAPVRRVESSNRGCGRLLSEGRAAWQGAHHIIVSPR
jgi:hypothetical protein